MSEREEKIVEAAIRVFSRYGVKRTTMNDIAGEAGIARQTLYNVYACKDEVLRATIQWHTDRSLAAIEAECANAATLGDKLDIVFEHMVVRPFELLHASPHADDIISGFNDAAKEEISIAGDRYRVAIESILQPHEKQIRAKGSSPHQLSDFVRNAATGFKHDARDKEHLSELLRSLKIVVLTLTDGTRPE